MEVRSATPADTNAIAAINVASWRAAYTGVIPSHVLDELDAEKLAVDWAGYIAAPFDPDDRLLVIHDDERVVGYARTSRSRDDDLDPKATAEVCGFYIHPDRWGGGAGRALMEASLGDLAARGFEVAVLWVVIDNERARGFYDHLGFAPDGRADKPFYGASQIRYRIGLRGHG